MAKMTFDEEGFLKEPCLSCDKCYTKNPWSEWYCDEKECLHNTKEVLDNIRAEIASYGTNSGMLLALEIIDKYRGE